LAISLTTPELFSEVADGVTCNRFGDCVSLLREPEAGNPHIRFDEREQEPESCQTGLRRRSESYANCHRETTATAPVLDSTNVKYYFTFPISRQIRVSGLLNHASLERLAYPDYSTFITERDISVFVFRVFYQNNVT
jgi:hypothetical protein